MGAAGRGRDLVKVKIIPFSIAFFISISAEFRLPESLVVFHNDK